MIKPPSLDSKVLASAFVTTSAGNVSLSLTRGEVLMVAGPNGAGKSALLYSIYRSIGKGLADYYAGHRQITFNHGWENVSSDKDQLATYQFENFTSSNRYKNHWAEDVFKSIIKRLNQAEGEYNSNLVELLDHDPINAQKFKKTNPSPIAKLNSVFDAARMAVRFEVDFRGLRAKRGSGKYDIDQLSDGERAALFIAGAVLIQDSNKIIAIDEPERNLHPSIVVPFINSLINARPDIGYIFASHDVNLISCGNINTLVHVRDSQIIYLDPETRQFDAEVVVDFEEIDEGLRRDLLGARQKLLFIEGTPNSIDYRIYNVLFPDWKVTPKGGAQEVIEAVKSLRKNNQLHWVEAKGLIDRDGRPDPEVQALEADGIHALLCPTSENLLFLPKVVEAVAQLLFEAEGGLDVHARMQSVKAEVRASLGQSSADISARLATWRINRILAEAKVSVANVRQLSSPEITLGLGQILTEADSEIAELCALADGLESVQTIPIKNTPVGSRIAVAMGCDAKRYKNIVFRQLGLTTECGEIIKSAMLEFLPTLGAGSK